MGTQKSIKSKMNFFKEAFYNARKMGISLNEKKLIAQFCINCESTERRAKELIKLFETAGEIYRIGTELMSEELFNEVSGKSLDFKENISRMA